MTKQELIKKIESLKVGEGIDIVDYSTLGDPLYHGIRLTSLIDCVVYAVASYGGYLESFNDDDYSPEDIANNVWELIESHDEAKFREVAEF